MKKKISNTKTQRTQSFKKRDVHFFLCLCVFVALCFNSFAKPVDLSTFQINPQFQIELLASEPAVTDPVDMAWDEKGDLYVVEMTGYPYAPTTERPYPGKIIRLEAQDEKGVYQK